MHQIYKKGFTLIEMIISLVVLGLIIVISVMVIINPILGFIDAKKRTDLVLIADYALMKIDAEIKNALPNSIRITNSGLLYYIEFTPIISSGRYLAGTSDLLPVGNNCFTDDSGISDNNILSFNIADSCFTTVGYIDNVASVAPNNYVVLYNLGDGFSSDFYTGGGITGNNKSKIVSISNFVDLGSNNTTKITIESNKFSSTAPGNRFFITSNPVTFVCDPTSGTIRKYWNYGVFATQPTTFSSGNNALIATNVANCSFSYSNSLPNIRNGVLTSNIKITKDSNNINLYGVTHVSNVP